MTDHPYTNRLISEKSPYLLQHAHNPVDWYPWGEDAFHAARALDKPIFLSIGYATCHWCHVMEEESFSDPKTAEALNETFVCVKVDREEMPEIDALYMEFAQAMMAGAAGWPLNLVLTTDLKPFFATTYLPPESRHGLTGLEDLIAKMKEAWKSEERGRLLGQAEKVFEAFVEQTHTTGDEMPSPQCLDDTADLIFQMADPMYGGMRGTPKFPVGYQMNFMLRYSRSSQDSRALYFVEKTLDWMHRGGIYDHLGGGFARYSVDEKWAIPHFEKMSYDNAFLIEAYLEAWQVSKNLAYKKVAEEVADYLLRDMQREEGGFYSAEDADTEGREGLFYTWTFEEINNILGPGDAPLFCKVYDVTPQGNFEGRNVLHMTDSLEDIAVMEGIDVEGLSRKLELNRKTLFEARERKTHPFKDPKILSGWNGLIIHALCQLGCATGNPTYVEAAEKAARFIGKSLTKDSQLLRRWIDGEARFSAALDEYALLIRGLISLFEAERGTEWLEWAVEMATVLEREFKAEGGAFYQTNGLDPNVILRRCQYSDGAEPSGNGIHCENLIRLARLTQNDHFLTQATDIFRAARKFLENYPPGYLYHLIAFQRYCKKESPVFIVVLNEKERYKQEIHQLLYHCFIPHRSVIWKHTNDPNLEELAPFLRAYPTHTDETTLYILGKKDDQPVPLTNLSDMIEAVHSLR